MAGPAQPLTSPRHLLAAIALVIAFTIGVRWLGLHLLLPALGGVVGGLAVMVVQFGLILWFGLVRLAGVRLRDVGWRLDGWRRQLAVGAAGFVALSIGLVALLAPLGALDVAATARAIAAYTPGQRVFFAALGVQAALAEETLFRGYLQGALAHRVGVGAAVLATALVFALSHLTLAPVRLLGLVWIGLVLGALRGGDRPLVAPAVAHALLWAVWGDA